MYPCISFYLYFFVPFFPSFLLSCFVTFLFCFVSFSRSFFFIPYPTRTLNRTSNLNSRQNSGPEPELPTELGIEPPHRTTNPNSRANYRPNHNELGTEPRTRTSDRTRRNSGPSPELNPEPELGTESLSPISRLSSGPNSEPELPTSTRDRTSN